MNSSSSPTVLINLVGLEISSNSLHPLSEQIVGYLCKATNTLNPSFFRNLVAFYMGVMASQMKVGISGYQPGVIPPNLYTIALSSSGSGKGYSLNLLENHLLGGFRQAFAQLFNRVANHSLEQLAQDRSVSMHIPLEEALAQVEKEYEASGAYVFSFDSGTLPAVKQLRHKLLMVNLGSLNYIVDELGSNLLKETELLTAFLELYDLGLIKEKLTKVTKDNQRFLPLAGYTPSNMLLFGTPSRIFDGDKTEATFLEFLETGYARRCLFSFSRQVIKTSESERDFSGDFLQKTSDYFAALVCPENIRREIPLSMAGKSLLFAYKAHCSDLARELPEHRFLVCTELENRFFKAMKLAGIYAFIDGKPEIDVEALTQAIALVELSGEAFAEILKPEKAYMKLAKYIAEVGYPVTHADIAEELPYFKGSKAQKEEMLSHAIAWGYRNALIIKRYEDDGITFFSGEQLRPTDLNKLIVSVSRHLAYGFKPEQVSWERIALLGKTSDYHWCNHHFKEEHRKKDNVLYPFNLLVLDFDNTATIELIQSFFAGFKHFIYTTKSHSPSAPRFRFLLPLNYVLHLSPEDYKQFVLNLADAWPFEFDLASADIAHKWLSNEGECYLNEGELFDVVNYIPKTKRNAERQQQLSKLDIGRLEHWFLGQLNQGNRNKTLFSYAMVLWEQKQSLEEIKAAVLALNKLSNAPLSSTEIQSTIFKTLESKYV